MVSNEAPLRGLRVVDLSRYLPGPFLTRILADLGAEVVKIEPPHGDEARALPPFHEGVGAAYAALNAGKTVLALDLKAEADQTAARHIIARSDVVVESFRPGVLARLGLGYEALSAENPRLVYCSLTGFGVDNPDQGRAGHDLNFLARSGILSLLREGEPPKIPAIQLADIAGGSLPGAVRVLAALWQRQRTGRGCHVIVNMTASVGALAAMAAPTRALSQDPLVRTLLTGDAPCYRLYPTQDGRHLAVGALEPKFFARFVAALGLPELSASGLCRGAEGQGVVEAIEARLREGTQAHWGAFFSGVDCCVEPVLTLEEAIAGGHVTARVEDGLPSLSLVGAVGTSAVPALGGVSPGEVLARWD